MASNGPPGHPAPSPRPGAAGSMDKLRSDFASLQQQLALLQPKRADGTAATPLHGSAAAAVPLSSQKQPGQPLQPVQLNAAQPHMQPQARPPPSSATPAAAAAPTASVSKAPMAAPPCVSAALHAAADTTQDSMQLQAATESSGAAALQAMRCGSRHAGSALGRVAVEMFEEPAFTQLLQEGLCSQLQRSAEGATSQTRILELAGAAGTCAPGGGGGGGAPTGVGGAAPPAWLAME